MDLSSSPASLDHDLVTQLLLARGVPHDDVERHRNPSLRAFLPDPSAFRDMDVAAERLAQAVLTGESLTVYGDYDVDGSAATSLFIRFFNAAPSAPIPPTVSFQINSLFVLSP